MTRYLILSLANARRILSLACYLSVCARCQVTELTTKLQRRLTRGYASATFEHHEQVYCLAVPIRNRHSTVVAAAGISGSLT
ncbi:MAG: IclR family transcriptional regulator C-terminal domain-containing protein [Rheinheimera sp.]|nr:IclR family transcriptional regulator C-terminal domain-containing protein [Rheinheimera sp.]